MALSSARRSPQRGGGFSKHDLGLSAKERLEQQAALRRFTLHYGQTLAWQAQQEGYRIISIFAGTGGGKALALDTPIPTPTGWTTMGDLRVGDAVYDERGQPCHVLNTNPVMHDHTCYDVVFSDGSVLTADADHLWLTHSHAYRKSLGRRIARPAACRRSPQTTPTAKPQVLTTEQVRASLYLPANPKQRANHAVPLAAAIQCPERELPIDPYVLGVWLGDGTSVRAEVTTMDPPILAAIAAAGYAVTLAAEGNSGLAATYRIGARERRRDPLTGRMIGNGSLESMLRTHGLLHNKHVPAAYLRASVEQRTALLMGLMDTDGTIDEDGGCTFDNTKVQLAQAVYDLAAGLGLKPTRQFRTVLAPSGERVPCHRVAFTPHHPVFRLPRKLARQRLAAVRATQHYRYIVAVRARPSVPVRCITVDSPGHLYLAGQGYIPTHNTWYGARHHYPRFREPDGLRKTYLWTEPTYRMLKRVMLPTALPFLDAFQMGTMRWGDMVYEFHQGGRILFGSVDNPNSLQGAHIDGGIWSDEIGLYAKEAWDVLMQRAALYKAPILTTSTPYTLPWVERELSVPAHTPENAITHAYRVIHFASHYNPAYPVDEYFRLKRAWPADKFRRLMQGLFTPIGGLAAEGFDSETNLATIYVLAPQTAGARPQLWVKHASGAGYEVDLVRCWLGQDWGWNPDPGYQILLGQDAYGRIYAIEEDCDTHIHVERGTSEGADTWVARALARQERWFIDAVYCDPASPADIELMRMWGLPAAKAINSQEYGMDTVNAAMAPLGGGLGAGLVIALNGCPELARTLGSLVRAKEPGSDDQYQKKVAARQDDHPYDGLRYALCGDVKRDDNGPHDLPPTILAGRRGSGPSTRRR